ncbi:hypothetical protein LEP1GSC050_3338 [Leptospira broomii serovar Hurstbridge str. 5399]|uniref:NHL repeat protein n=1 Tax=Leptospira broomii serovar Hurstbridge str. 5399 TaxID=1049789 RepID=T0GGM7_9LEPT|nr:hypothetical protein [Leptospira broomii]EQA44553.1 hypothetical protein LEP1GSC050_3338 [Leptospira broomii serovar Hurstbridge str. 5399]
MERNSKSFWKINLALSLFLFLSAFHLATLVAQEEVDLEIPLTDSPYGLSYDGTNFWFADSKRRAIFKVDPTGRQEVFNLGIPFISGLSFDSREGRVFVAAKRVILKVEPNTGGVTDRIAIPIDKIGGIASFQNYLYVLDADTGKVSVYDKGTQSIIGGFLTDRTSPKDICYARNSIWVTDSSDGNIYRYDPANGRITGSIRTPTKDIRGLAIIGSKIFVVDRTSREIKKISFVETDRFLASGESTYLINVKIKFNLNEASLVGGALGLLPPPTTEHQRIRNLKSKDPKFKGDFVSGARGLSKKLGIDDPKGNQTLEYQFEARTTNVRFYVMDDFIQKKEEIPTDLSPFVKTSISVKDKNGTYFIDKIFDARLFRTDWESFKKALLDAGLPVRSVRTLVLSNQSSPVFKDALDAYIPGFGWVPLSSIKPETVESSRTYQKSEEVVDLYRSEGWGTLPSPVLYKAKDSDFWKPIPAEIEVKVLPKGSDLGQN